MDLTKSLSQPGTITLLYNYESWEPYLPPDIISKNVTVNMLNLGKYADMMADIVGLQEYNREFDSDGL